jgi:hypothetical protein
MVEVFKTDVCDKAQAEEILAMLKGNFTEYKVNFDLEDCDKILRVQSFAGNVETERLILLMKSAGVSAEPLPDLPD